MDVFRLDVRTIMVVMVVGNLIAASLLALYRYRDQRPKLFLAATLGQAIAWTLLGLRDIIDFFWSYMIGNILLNLAFIAEAVALLTIDGRKQRVEQWYVLLAITATLMVIFHYVQGSSLNTVAAAGSVLTLLIFIAPAFEFCTQPDASPLRRALGSVYVAYCVAAIIRAGYMLTSQTNEGLMTPSAVQTPVFMTLFGMLMFGKLGYVLLINEKTDHELKMAATTDTLTGINNRRAFFSHAEMAVNLAIRRHDAITLLILDLDHFKNINDERGHAAGDAVLRHFAATTRDLIRPHDIFGRLGGEEFVILLIGDARVANDIAERVRSTIERKPCPSQPGLKYTVSIGGATVVPKQVEELQPLLQRADETLYLAKRAGRNRVVMAEPE